MNKISYETAHKAIEKLSIFGRYMPHLIADILGMLESSKYKKERKN